MPPNKQLLIAASLIITSFQIDAYPRPSAEIGLDPATLNEAGEPDFKTKRQEEEAPPANETETPVPEKQPPPLPELLQRLQDAQKAAHVIQYTHTIEPESHHKGLLTSLYDSAVKAVHHMGYS